GRDAPPRVAADQQARPLSTFVSCESKQRIADDPNMGYCQTSRVQDDDRGRGASRTGSPAWPRQSFWLVVLITRGTSVKPLRSFWKHCLAACLSHRRCTRISRTCSSWSTARQRACRSPWVVRKTSATCYLVSADLPLY